MAQCKWCDKEVVWGTTAEGKKVMLDPKAPVYSVILSNGETKLIRTMLAMVTHYSTCDKVPDASEAVKV